jgi:soluble P-type ATPase
MEKTREIRIELTNQNPIIIRNILTDLNGTLKVDGKMHPEVITLLQALREECRVIFLSGDGNGTAKKYADETGCELKQVSNAQEKADYAEEIGLDHVAVIGNGAGDVPLFKTVLQHNERAPRVAVVEAEGLYVPLLAVSNIMVRSAKEALQLFLTPGRLQGLYKIEK